MTKSMTTTMAMAITTGSRLCKRINSINGRISSNRTSLLLVLRQRLQSRWIYHQRNYLLSSSVHNLPRQHQHHQEHHHQDHLLLPSPLLQVHHKESSATNNTRLFTSSSTINGTGRDNTGEDNNHSKTHERGLYDFLANEVGIVINDGDNNNDDDNILVYDSILKTIQDINGLKEDEITVPYLESLGRDILRELADSVIQQEQKRSRKNAEETKSKETGTTTGTTTAASKRTRRWPKRPIPSLPVRLYVPTTKSSPGNNNDDEGNQHQQDTTESDENVRVVDIDWRVGEKLMAAIKRYNNDLVEATCGGQASCSTCHVYLLRKRSLGQEKYSDGIIDMIPPPDENELDMIDLAWQEPDLDENVMISRLSCQIRLTPGIIDVATTTAATAAATAGATAALEVQIPNDSHDLWDG